MRVISHWEWDLREFLRPWAKLGRMEQFAEEGRFRTAQCKPQPPVPKALIFLSVEWAH